MKIRNSKFTVGLRDLYKHYLYKAPILLGNAQDANYYIKKSDICDTHKHSVNFFLYQKIIELYLEEVFNLVMAGNRFEIPHGLGTFYLKKYKSKRKRVDYKTFNQTGKIKYLDNFHTDNHIVAFFWDNTSKVITNRNIYMFSLVEKRMYELVKMFKEDLSLINKCVSK